METLKRKISKSAVSVVLETLWECANCNNENRVKLTQRLVFRDKDNFVVDIIEVSEVL
jgi:hypothetical protein